MKCRIGNTNLKVWGKAIQTLISTGDDDVHFQFAANLVTITTFDASLTVSCSCAFEKEFFEFYESASNGNSFIACRVPSKCLLKAFRSLRFLSKSVLSCEITLQENNDSLEIALLTKFGPVIRYSLRLAVETEALEIDSCPEVLSNWIKVNPKFILGTVSNFGPTNKIADLTLKTMDNKILLKNCTTDVVKREGKIYTELSVNSVDFAEYCIRQDSEITVPLREFKAFVSFAEGLKLDLSLHFQGPKDPVIIVIQNELYKATLNLATRVAQGGNNSQAMSPATSGLISNVTSQQPPAEAPIPVVPHETSVRNVADPVADFNDSEEGIFDQVNELESSKASSSTSVMSKRGDASNLNISIRSNMANTSGKFGESCVNVKGDQFKVIGNIKTYARVDSLTNAAIREQEIKEIRSAREKSIEQARQLHTPAPINLEQPERGVNSLVVHVDEMESDDLKRIFNDSMTFGNSNKMSPAHHGQPPRKRAKTFKSMFPDIGKPKRTIPGMDIILLPASDEEDN